MCAVRSRRNHSYLRSIRCGGISTVRSRPERRGCCNWEDGSRCGGRTGAPPRSNPPPRPPQSQLYSGGRTPERPPAGRKLKLERRICLHTHFVNFNTDAEWHPGVLCVYLNHATLMRGQWWVGPQHSLGLSVGGLLHPHSGRVTCCKHTCK